MPDPDQDQLIQRVRDLCATDDRLDAVLTYGSIAQGVGDRYSDIEFWFFATSPIDGPGWCTQIGSIRAITANEFGAYVVIFPGLIRGEFHFATVEDLPIVATWRGLGAPPDAMIVKDRRGVLRSHLSDRPAEVPSSPAEIEQLCLRYANWLVLALNVTARGEILRAHDALGHARRHLLWMARLDAGATATWVTPSRRAEADLPHDVLDGLRATLDPDRGLAASWHLGRSLWHRLAARFDFTVPAALVADLDTASGLIATSRRSLPDKSVTDQR